MFAGIKKLLLDLYTEDDANSVFCPVRFVAPIVILGYLGLIAYMAIAHGQFDPLGTGTGLASLLTAFGAAIGIKSKLGG